MEALKNVSGFKWDEENGADVDGDTLAVWNAYVEVSTTLTLHNFTHHSSSRDFRRQHGSRKKGGHTILSYRQ